MFALTIRQIVVVVVIVGVVVGGDGDGDVLGPLNLCRRLGADRSRAGPLLEHVHVAVAVNVADNDHEM